MSKLQDVVLTTITVIVVTVVMMSLALSGLEKSDARRKEVEKVCSKRCLTSRRQNRQRSRLLERIGSWIRH
jgi:hypothetical protein